MNRLLGLFGTSSPQAREVQKLIKIGAEASRANAQSIGSETEELVFSHFEFVLLHFYLLDISILSKMDDSIRTKAADWLCESLTRSLSIFKLKPEHGKVYYNNRIKLYHSALNFGKGKVNDDFVEEASWVVNNCLILAMEDGIFSIVDQETEWGRLKKIPDFDRYIDKIREQVAVIAKPHRS